MNFRGLLLAVAFLLVVWVIARLIRTARYPLREKVVLITGGSRGLGLVIARQICARGSNVALIARDAGASELVRTASLGAIQAAERMRDALGADELKAWLLPSRRRPFELLFQAQAEAGEGMAALQTAERALARTFLDAFVEAHTLQGAADPVQAGSEAVTRADSLRAFIPVLRQSHVVATRPLAEVLPKLGDRHVLLYFATAEAMWLIQVAEQRVRLERLATSIADLQLLVDRFLRDPGDASAADELGTLLLPADVVLSKTELTLISTGPIAGLPFAALRRAGRTLVQDHVVHYVPSLSLNGRRWSAGGDRRRARRSARRTGRGGGGGK